MMPPATRALAPLVREFTSMKTFLLDKSVLPPKEMNCVWDRDSFESNTIKES
jgi:hypothetical protein